MTCNCARAVCLRFCLVRSPGREGELTVSVSVPWCACAVAAGAGPEVQQRQGEEELHCHAGLPAEHHQRLLAHGVPGELQGDRDDHQRGGEREGGFAPPGEMAQCGATVWLLSSERATECFVQDGCFESQFYCCILGCSVWMFVFYCCCMDEPLLGKKILISMFNLNLWSG